MTFDLQEGVRLTPTGLPTLHTSAGGLLDPTRLLGTVA
jgi:hypothetical protein